MRAIANTAMQGHSPTTGEKIGAAGLKGIWNLGKAALFTTPGQIFTGAAIGAGLASDSSSPTINLLNIAGGAMTGAAIGSIPFAAKTMGRSLWKGKGSIARFAGTAIKGGASLSLNVVKTAARFPNASLLLGGIGLGLAALAGSGNATSETNLTNRGRLAMAMGGTSYVSAVNSSLTGSTEGLVQGLHAGRHRG